jgi:hypothetical protein
VQVKFMACLFLLLPGSTIPALLCSE